MANEGKWEITRIAPKIRIGERRQKVGEKADDRTHQRQAVQESANKARKIAANFASPETQASNRLKYGSALFSLSKAPTLEDQASVIPHITRLGIPCSIPKRTTALDIKVFSPYQATARTEELDTALSKRVIKMASELDQVLSRSPAPGDDKIPAFKSLITLAAEIKQLQSDLYNPNPPKIDSLTEDAIKSLRKLLLFVYQYSGDLKLPETVLRRRAA